MMFRIYCILALMLSTSGYSFAAEYRIGFVSDGSVESLRVEGLVQQELTVLLGSDAAVKTTSYTGELSAQSFNGMLEKAYANNEVDAVVAPGFFGSNFLYNRPVFVKPTLLSWVIDPSFFGEELRKVTNLYWLSAKNDFDITLDNIKRVVNPQKYYIFVRCVS